MEGPTAVVDSATQSRFQEAVNFLNENKNNFAFDTDKQLALYGLFKQASLGRCNAPKPGFFDFVGKEKWNAWNRLGDMSKEKAMQDYVELVGQLVPSWKAKKDEKGQEQTALPPAAPPKKKGMVVFSRPTMSDDEDDSSDYDSDDEEQEKDTCYYAGEQDWQQVLQLLEEKRYTIGHQDSEGRTVLHWAADRGNAEMLQKLLQRGGASVVNVQDVEGMTPLHYACLSENEAIVRLLLENGAKVDVQSNDGATPAELADGASIQELVSAWKSE
ncbi:acyl-CoA binding domain-containing protein 6 [Balamuthia mandrillaris]